MKRLSVHELEALTAEDFPHISPKNKDDMAIPLYLHKNPLVRWLAWKRYERIAQLCEFNTGMRVLEFGCGIGVFLPELSRRCAKVYATDLFPDYARRLCRKRRLDVCFVNSLAEIPSGSLDLIIAADVLDQLSVPELDGDLSTFSEKLKETGRLIVSGPTAKWIDQLERVAASPAAGHDSRKHQIDDLILIIIKAGFVHLRLKTLPFVFPPYLFKICEFKKHQAG